MGEWIHCNTAAKHGSINFTIHIGDRKECQTRSGICLIGTSTTWEGMKEALEKANYTFESLFAKIQEEQKEGRKVLIHCSGGITRSPSLAIAYLMWSEGLPYEEAFSAVKKTYASIEIPEGFETEVKSISQ